MRGPDGDYPREALPPARPRGQPLPEVLLPASLRHGPGPVGPHARSPGNVGFCQEPRGEGPEQDPFQGLLGLLRQLEVEHARQVAELRIEISRLRGGGEVREASPSEARRRGCPRTLGEEAVDLEDTELRQEAVRQDMMPPTEILEEAAEEEEQSTEACTPSLRESPASAQVLEAKVAKGFPFVPMLPSAPESSEPLSEALGSEASRRQSQRSGRLEVGKEQLLKVTVLSACGLRRSDWMTGQNSDPYCVCSIAGKPEVAFQTHVISNTLRPEWNYEVVIESYEEGDSLEFVVKDHDWIGAHHLLGRASLPSSAFHPNGYEGQLQLRNAGNDEDAPAYLEVCVQVAAKQEVCQPRDCWLLERKGSVQPSEKRALKLDSVDFTPNDENSKRKHKDNHHSSPSRSFMLDPSAGGRLAWDIFGILLVCVDLVWLPLQAFDLPESDGAKAMAWIALIYWSLDIPMTFNTGTFKRGGYLIMDRWQVAFHYIKRWLALDLLLVVAEWIFLSNPGAADSAGAARAGKFVRASRSFRFLRLMRLAKLREVFFSLQVLINSEWMTVMFMVSRNLMSILALNHVLACLWFAVGTASEEGWVGQNALAREEPDVQYLISLQWSLAQFTPGAPPLQPVTPGERAFSISVLALGLVVATCFVSSITSTVSAVWAMQRNESTQKLLLKKFLKQNSISRSLGSRVTRYIDCVMELRQQKVHFSRVQYLSFLSGPLHVELLCELREPQLFIHSLFPRYKDTSVCAFRELCTTALEQSNFAKNDVLFHRKGEAKHMYFLNSGTMVYRTISRRAKDFIKRKLESGQWCTEHALWMPWQHAGDMKAVSDVDVTLLSVARFCEVTSSDSEAHHFAAHYCRCFAERVHMAAAFDKSSVTDLPLRIRFLGESPLYGGPEPPQPLEMLTPAAQYLRQAEDMEAELIAFADDLEGCDAKSLPSTPAPPSTLGAACRAQHSLLSYAEHRRPEPRRFSMMESLGIGGLRKTRESSPRMQSRVERTGGRKVTIE